MSRLPRKCIVLLALPALFLGCQKPAPAPVASDGKPAAEAPAPTWSDTVPHQREVDDTARFLAGMPGSPGSQFSAMEADDGWQEHRRLLDAAWAKADEKLIRGLHEFQQSELSAPPLDRDLLFYPFSGPDALTATACFPNASTYFLVALEPAGTLPTLDHLQEKKLAEYLGAVRTTMASELGKSFFVTREMDRQVPLAEAQAEQVAKFGPRKLWNMETKPDAMLEMSIGIINGESRPGPRWRRIRVLTR